MHFHVPKPLHGWRAFAGEVGIIVVIALGAEQVVESLHWAYPITLTADSRTEFVKSIERLHYHNDMMALSSRQMQEQIQELGETPTPQELSIVRRNIPHSTAPGPGALSR